jgi:hypothetical protein
MVVVECGLGALTTEGESANIDEAKDQATELLSRTSVNSRRRRYIGIYRYIDRGRHLHPISSLHLPILPLFPLQIPLALLLPLTLLIPPSPIPPSPLPLPPPPPSSLLPSPPGRQQRHRHAGGLQDPRDRHLPQRHHHRLLPEAPAVHAVQPCGPVPCSAVQWRVMYSAVQCRVMYTAVQCNVQYSAVQYTVVL